MSLVFVLVFVFVFMFVFVFGLGLGYASAARGESTANCATLGRKSAPSAQHMRSAHWKLSHRLRHVSATASHVVQMYGPRPGVCSRWRPADRLPSDVRWSSARSR